MDWYTLLNWGYRGFTDASWWQIGLYAIFATQLTIAGVTLYLHRCQAHRALDLHPAIAHVFRFWLWSNTGMVTRQWSAVHRKHHAKCETADDPHSPVTHGIKKVLLEGAELYRVESRNQETEDKYGHGAPDDWIERNLYSKHTMAGIYFTLVVDILLFGFAGISVFAIQMVWIPIMAAGIINGVGHHTGYRNFDAPDQSRNIVPWGLIIGGEELHNNHHAFATSAKFSSQWYEFDIGWMYIKILSFFGLATVKKVAPKPKFVQARTQLDFDALQAVIHHRYDLMAAYARTIRKECKSQNMSDLAKRWLHVDDVHWPEAQKAKIANFLESNERVKQLVTMREELSEIWARGSQTREQLLQQLQQWCQRAESSGNAKLQEMSLRVRSYAM
jgi:stearoyl-CoA desaturase (Delta-9 desaturase)